MNLTNITILHYSAPPIVGGVESVMQAHARLFLDAGYQTTIVAGAGEKDALPPGTKFVRIPEMDSQNPQITALNRDLELGRVPENFNKLTADLTNALQSILSSSDLLIVHNVFTKHFNLALSAALFRLLDQRKIQRCVAWCHDFTWTSSHSRSKVYPGYPWDLLRTYRSDVTYVTISQARRIELANLFGRPLEQIRVIYNGTNPQELLGLSSIGTELIDRLELWDSDLNLLMPIRVTQAKNIELAIQVAASLKQQGINPKIIITGPPDPHDEQNMRYFEDLLTLRKKLDVENEVRFVFESGANKEEPFIVDMSIVGELFRVNDALFMPSHREGFGMPIIEAGMVGIPVFCSDQVPAAKEIGVDDVILFDPESGAEKITSLILDWVKQNPVYHLRRRVRQRLLWKNIFRHEIQKLLDENPF